MASLKVICANTALPDYILCPSIHAKYLIPTVNKEHSNDILRKLESLTTTTICNEKAKTGISVVEDCTKQCIAYVVGAVHNWGKRFF